MKRVAVIGLLVALTGCSSMMTKTETYWDKAGASQQDFDIDHGQCSAQAFSVTGGNLMQVALVQSSCMRGKGWRLLERQVPRF